MNSSMPKIQQIPVFAWTGSDYKLWQQNKERKARKKEWARMNEALKNQQVLKKLRSK